MNNDAVKAMSAYQASRRIVLGICIGLICLVLVFGRSLQGESAHELIETYGLALILFGIGGRLWATLYIGGRKSAEIVATGPYSVMRNPLYFFSTIAAAGIGAQTGSITIAVAMTILCAIAFHVVTLREERHLKAILGTPYEAYLAHVPRFFPDPRLFKDDKEVVFKPRLLNRTLLDGLVFLVSIPFFELIEVGQEAGWIQVLFRVY